MKKIFFSILMSAAMIISMLVLPVNVKAASMEPELINNKLFLNGNDAEIVANPSNENSAIVKSAGREFVVNITGLDSSTSYIFAGGNNETSDENYGTVHITMTSGKVDYIIGSNYKRGNVNTANIVINGGTVGMAHGGPKYRLHSGTFAECDKNSVTNANITMNGGIANALVPGTFDLTYVKNATVTVNGGQLTAKTNPAQTGILGGTNGRVDNLTINVKAGSINGISLGQRTMITNKAIINIIGGNVGDIYAGSFYNDGETDAGWWNESTTPGQINFGQAKAIEVNVGSHAVYNNIYGGFQYHNDKTTFDSSKVYPYSLRTVQNDLINNSSRAPLIMNLASTPTKKINQQYAKEMIDSTDSFVKTNWLVNGVKLDKTTISLEAGKTVTLNSSVSPVNATDKAVSWSSSHTAIATVDDSGKVTAVSKGTATITATVGYKSGTCVVTVTNAPTPVVPDKPIDVPTIDTTTPPKDVTVGIQDKASQEVISNTVDSILEDIISGKEISKDVMNSQTLKAVKDALAAGKDVSPKVDAKTVDKNSVDKVIVDKVDRLVEKFAKANNTNVTVAQYLDLGVLLMAGSSELGSVHLLEKPIEFTVALPTSLAKDGRMFYVVRIHDGVAEKLATKMNEDGTLTFKTDRFSTYAVVYEEKKDGKVTTSDESQTLLYAAMGAMAVIGVGLIFVLKKKEELMK